MNRPVALASHFCACHAFIEKDKQCLTLIILQTTPLDGHMARSSRGSWSSAIFRTRQRRGNADHTTISPSKHLRHRGLHSTSTILSGHSRDRRVHTHQRNHRLPILPVIILTIHNLSQDSWPTRRNPGQHGHGGADELAESAASALSFCSW